MQEATTRRRHRRDEPVEQIIRRKTLSRSRTKVNAGFVKLSLLPDAVRLERIARRSVE
jgi:hypothetical protein